MQPHIKSTIHAQRSYFKSDRTKNVNERIRALKLIRASINDHNEALSEAIYKDLKKSNFEFFVTEIAMVLDEINLLIKNLSKWSTPKRVKSSLLQFKARSYIYPEPYGQVLIISPWNYPFQLNFLPLAGAIAAGNTVVLKPSPDAPHTAEVIEEMIKKCFPPEYVTVFKGGKETNHLLLKEKFDLIFFTGSPQLGRVVMKAASEHLTPVILELGGKNPCIVHKDADIKRASRRIIWGKHLNVGQTCTSPDYLLAHSDIKTELILQMIKEIKAFWGDDPRTSPDYSRIVTSAHMNRLMALLDSGTIIHGGETDPEDLYISPTILDNVNPDAPAMQEEIFGPILPVMAYSDLNEAIAYVSSHPKPLALYLFTRDSGVREKILNTTSSGGCTINDTLMHVTNSHLPFGGVGESGMGAYHGKTSFHAFSHNKSVLIRSNIIDPSVRYAPYSEKKKRIMAFLMTRRFKIP